MTRRQKINSFIQYAVLLLIALIFILPLLWMLISSIDTNAVQALRIPENISFQNYMDILSEERNRLSFGNGLLISGGQTIVVIFLCIIAAYPLSRFKLSYKKSFMMTILFMTSLPMTVVIVPVFQLFLTLRFMDSQIAVMFFMSATSLPMGIWMMKNFMDSVPIDLEESAWIDGVTLWRGILKVVVPLMIPGIFTVAIFTFSGSWGNFFVPFMLLTSTDNLPASVTIFQFFGNFGLVNYGRLAAFSVLYTLPIVILYAISQQFMSKGFSMGGAVK